MREVEIAGQKVQLKEGVSLLESLLDAGVSIDHACGGFCACTTCRVQVVSDSNAIIILPLDDERERAPAGMRLACQMHFHEDRDGDICVQLSSS